MAADSAISKALSAPNRLRKAIGSNFYTSFLFLPASKRRAITNVYRFARVLDDIVDNDQTGRDPEAELQYWRDELEYCYLGQAETSLGEELMMTIDEFDIPKQPFMDLIEGMEMDLKWSSYQTFSDLREYCYRAASAVGLICIEIFGYDSPGTREYAVNLGLALQLTNILRDLQEDAARGRIYIPIEDLERFGYSEADMKASLYNRPFVDLMKYQHKRARYYFDRAAATLPEQDRPSMVAAEIMGAIYKELLGKIEDAQFDVYRNRITVSKMQRLKIALNIWLKSRFGKY
jgi:15-cis-phytoene synthase